MLKIFTEDFIKEIGFKFSNGDENSQYGEAVSLITRGMTVINWNTGGHTCTYFGDNLNENVSVSIKKDAGSRTVFNGYVYSQDDMRMLLDRTL